jgi:hypothetical protein
VHQRLTVASDAEFQAARDFLKKWKSFSTPTKSLDLADLHTAALNCETLLLSAIDTLDTHQLQFLKSEGIAFGLDLYDREYHWQRALEIALHIGPDSLVLNLTPKEKAEIDHFAEVFRNRNSHQWHSPSQLALDSIEVSKVLSPTCFIVWSAEIWNFYIEQFGAEPETGSSFTPAIRSLFWKYREVRCLRRANSRLLDAEAIADCVAQESWFSHELDNYELNIEDRKMFFDDVIHAPQYRISLACQAQKVLSGQMRRDMHMELDLVEVDFADAVYDLPIASAVLIEHRMNQVTEDITRLNRNKLELEFLESNESIEEISNAKLAQVELLENLTVEAKIVEQNLWGIEPCRHHENSRDVLEARMQVYRRAYHPPELEVHIKSLQRRKDIAMYTNTSQIDSIKKLLHRTDPNMATSQSTLPLPVLPEGWSAENNFKAIGTLTAATERSIEPVGPHFLAHARRVSFLPCRS